MIPELQVEGHRLVAVPAIHYRAVFAEVVQRVCGDEATRPRAVAVELGQGAVDALVHWMRELGVGALVPAPLPCMLGLASPNRLLHPRHRPAALRLQEVHGKPLPELPAGLLHEHLDFSTVQLLCLSATDSIIEAVRSAVEQGLPVYGVDLEESANVRREAGLIQDPAEAGQNLARWVKHNAPLAATNRDAWVDGRREEAMAARLKLLLRRHDCVLFTCGLGHWVELVRRLDDPAQPAATILPVGDATTYTRVLVDPMLAIRQMDLFPDFTRAYELLRNLPPAAPERRQGFGDVFKTKVTAAFHCAEAGEREAVARLALYLSRLGLVSQQSTIDLCSMINAADSMVSTGFARRLATELVGRALPWAEAEKWPNLPCLRPAPALPNERRFTDGGQRAELIRNGRRVGSFTLDDASPHVPPPVQLYLPPVENDQRLNVDRRAGGGSSWVWPPCEHLFFGTAYAAARRAQEEACEHKVEPFGGSLHDGLDPKSTLRAHARGDRRVQVRHRPPGGRKEGREAITEPVVFIFPPEDNGSRAHWNLLQGGWDHEPYVRDLPRYLRVRKERGRVFVSSVHFGRSCALEAHLQPWVSELRLIWGSVSFGNPCINTRQAVRWLEEENYECCPILRSGGIEELAAYYRETHGVELDLEDWRTTLIRIALPYAQRRVVVLAPDGFRLPVALEREAASHRRQIAVQPLSSYSAERVNAVRRQYLVRTCDRGGLKFPEEFAAAIGQPPDAGVELLPDWIRAQLVETN